MATSEWIASLSRKAAALLQEDADKIEQLIEVQMEHLANRRCPLYEEVLDTQMYGLSREVDFAIRVGLVDEHIGKQILSRLEQDMAVLFGALEQQQRGSNQDAYSE